MTFILASGPRLHPRDIEYAEQQPLKTQFEAQDGCRLSRHQYRVWLDETVAALLAPKHKGFWWPVIKSWLKFCLDLVGSMLPQSAAELFVKVLWQQSPFNLQQDTELEPLELLRRTQNSNAQSHFLLERRLPRRITVFDALGEESSDEENTESEGSDADFEDSTELKLTERGEKEEELESGKGHKRRRCVAVKPVATSGPPRAPSVILTSRNKTEWCNELEDTTILRYVVEKWVADLNLHFGWREWHGDERYPDAGAILQQMNTLRPSIYAREEFRRLVKSSGLAMIFNNICDPENDREADPELAASYRLFNWRNQLNFLWNKWTPQVVYNDCQWEMMPAEFGTPGGNAPMVNVLRALCTQPWMIPRSTSPTMAVFFLASRQNFVQAWEMWLAPFLRRVGMDIVGFDPCALYKAFTDTTCAALPALARKRHLDIPEDVMLLLRLNEEHRQFLKTLHDRARNPAVRAASKRDEDDRKAQYHARRKAHPPATTSYEEPKAQMLPAADGLGLIPFEQNPKAWGRLRRECPTCKNYVQPDDKCVRIWYVDRRKVKGLHGCVISSAAVDDRLEPKTWDVHGADAVDTTAWWTPQELDLRELTARETPHIIEGCKRDITLLVDTKTQRQVGSIFFGAVTGTDLEDLQKANDSLLLDRNIKRSNAQQKWAYGSMTGYGSRSPQGGHRGDSYRPYPHVQAETEADVKQLFAHARAADTIVSIVETMDPEAANVMRMDAGLDPLGATRCNLFGCHDYMSCGHSDRDGAPKDKSKKKKKVDPSSETLSDCVSCCIQYEKNCKTDEFNFSFTEWGVLVRTIPGCVWAFNGRDMHQVTLPRRSSVENAGTQPMCSGTAPTVATVNVSKAKAFMRARRLRAVTAEYWRGLERSTLEWKWCTSEE
ncbi:hypothetical protein C8R47DRAFT_1197521 [Mycena vitilis]|nr:hypothetical protein C8R47DRAFT_1197521 [Mycena vitilis]